MKIKAILLFFALIFCSLQASANDNECAIFLSGSIKAQIMSPRLPPQKYPWINPLINPPTNPLTRRQTLVIPQAKRIEVLKNLLNKVKSNLGEEHLYLVSEWLRLNGVNHRKLESHILILPGDESELNRFASRIGLFYKKHSSNNSFAPTELIFNPSQLRTIHADGYFRWFSSQSASFSFGSKTILKTDIGLSINGILDLRPTQIEHHEMVHWSYFFKRIKGNFNSFLNGDLDHFTHEKPVHEHDQSQSFSLEEFEAHMLTLSAFMLDLYGQKFANLNAEDKNKLLYDLRALRAYATTARKVFFRTLGDSNLFKDGGLFFDQNENSWEKINSHQIKVEGEDSAEYLSLETIPGGDETSRHIKYFYQSHDKRVGLELLIPVPAGIFSIDELLQPEFKEQFLEVIASAYLRLHYLIRMTKYVVELKAEDLVNESSQNVSPRVYLQKLQAEYLQKLENVKKTLSPQE